MRNLIFHIDNCILRGRQPSSTVELIDDQEHYPDVIQLNYYAGVQSNMFDINPPIFRKVYMDGTQTVQASGSVDDFVGMLLPGKVFIDLHPGSLHDFSVSPYTPPAGVYRCAIIHLNIDFYPLPTGNVSILQGSVGVLPAARVSLPDNMNVKKKATCACEKDTQSGGDPLVAANARSVATGGSSGGGSSVIRHAEPEYMEFSFIFGAFRGMAGVPAARLELLSYTHTADTLSHAGLAVSHPVCSCVRPQSASIAPNESFAVYTGNAYTVYLCSGDGRSAMGAGVFSDTSDIVRFVTDIATDESVETDLSHASYLRICSADGSAAFYDLQTYKFAAYITEFGYVLTAADALRKLAVVRDENDNVRQVWSAWDGLADIVPNAAGQGYTISLYLPNQVTPPVDASSPYTVTGTPFKTFTVGGDSTAGTVSVAERDNSLPASMPDFVTTWCYAGGVWSMTTGSGETAVSEQRVRRQIDAHSYRVVTTRSKGSVMTSRECDVYQLTDLGPQIASHTDGYDTPEAATTTYEYDETGNMVKSVSPTGAVHEFRHDANCRQLLSSEPWAQGGRMLHSTEYRDEPGRYRLDPVSSHVQAVGADRQVYPVRDTEYTYIETADVKRVEVRTTAASGSAEHLTVEETWLAAASNVFARGRIKMRQDVNGVQTHYAYEASSQYGALYRVTEETRAGGVPTPGLSTRNVRYFSDQGNLLREERYALSTDGDWLPLSGATHTYDCQNRRIATLHDNGRSSSRSLICTGAILSETDEDGVTTDYAYDSARMLVETTRAAVYDGDTCITPETITEYVRDAEGRATATTTRAGALTTVSRTAYDALGRIVSQTDALGRTTITAYSADGLTTTQTTPSGATLVTTRNTDGSTARVSGTGQRELKYAYDVSSGRMRTTVRLADDSILSQTLENGFGETVVEAEASTTGFIYTRSEYNNRGLLTRMYQDTSMGATPTASTLFEYDSFGNVTRRVLALDEEPSPLNSPVEEFAYGVEEGTDGVYSVTTRTRYNAAGTALTSTRKELVSSLSSTLAEKSVAIDERGLTSTEWTEYGVGTVKDSYSSVPTSSITAHRVMVDGFTVSQSDHAGVASTQSRRFTETGLELTQTDGRGNATTTCTDIAGRTVSVTDAAGNTTSTAYSPYFDEPSVVTDACGKTACYKYDIRGRKVAEWGTAIQPACFGYDDADRMTSLTTFRAGTETISTDPSSRTDGDVTTWAYHATTGLEVSKTYADGKGTVKTYDAFNRLSTETDAREKVKTCSYEHARGLLLGISYSDNTTSESFAYNHLGQLTQVTDDAGVRSIGYNAYGEQETDSLLAEGVTHLVTETRDSLGRSTGYTYAKDSSVQQTVTTAYGTDGRISGAGFLHGGQEKQFTYGYLQGTHLLQTLTKPNGMTLTQSYEQHRDLLTQMDYHRGNTLVASRSYQYDSLGRPTSRTLARQGATRNDVFTYNDRSELISDVVDDTDLNGWDYDNIGNRRMEHKSDGYEVYTANQLNQYTAIEDQEGTFQPTYDDDGNQTRVKTGTGIWDVTYNAKNRPVLFSKEGENLTVACTYDYMGRRATKVVTENGVITTSHRFLYRGYLQIACCDRKRSTHPCLWLITWDPSQPVATRPLAIQKDSTWYTYGWDLTKNVWEVYGTTGYIGTAYTYTAYGQVTASGSITQPIQWSSEYNDTELGLVYYNYRHYNPIDGRWNKREQLGEIVGLNMHGFVENSPCLYTDYTGLFIDTIWDVGNMIWDAGVIVAGAITSDKEMMKEGATDLMLDTAAAIIPGLPAGASKAARVAQKAAAKTARQAEKEAARRAKKVTECLGYHTAYHAADQLAGDCSQSTCCSEFIKKLTARASEIRLRRIYLKKGCDYYLPGSLAKTPKVAIQNHKGELKHKRINFNNCLNKAIQKGCAGLPIFAL